MKNKVRIILFVTIIAFYVIPECGIGELFAALRKKE